MPTKKGKTLKLAVLLLALSMVFTLSFTALAEDVDGPEDSTPTQSESIPAQEPDPGEDLSGVEEPAPDETDGEDGEESEEGDDSDSEEDPDAEAEEDEDVGSIQAVDGLLDLEDDEPSAGTYAEFVAELAAIPGEGTILITSSFALESTVSIPAGQNITLRSESGSFTLTQSAGPGQRHFSVEGALTLENIVLDGAEANGGVQVNGGSLTLGEGAVITNCRNQSSGGAVHLQDADMLIEGGEISYSQTPLSTSVNGGGISVNSSSLTMRSGSIHHNASVWGGGLELIDGSTFLMEGGSIAYNKSTLAYGGGVSIGSGSTFTLNDGYIEYNESSVGAGVYLGGGSYVVGNEPILMYFNMNGGTIRGNEAETGGGIACAYMGVVNITNGLITQNVADDGGGIAITEPSPNVTMSLTITGGEISYNEAGWGEGGAIMAYSPDASSPITVVVGSPGGSGPKIHHNEATMWGGALSMYTWVNTTMYSGSIYNNTCYAEVGTNRGMGGGVTLHNGASLTMHDGSIHNNRAYSWGGGVAVSAATFTMLGGSLHDNQANTWGGAVFGGSAGTEIQIAGTVENNKANIGGGFYIASATSKLFLNAGAIVRGNEARTGAGGGIWTTNYSYSDPASASGYQNLTIDPTVIFSGNKATAAYMPPSNADDFTNLGYAQSSIANGNGWQHILNNYDVNYVLSSRQLLDVTFDANGGSFGDSIAAVTLPKQINTDVTADDVAGIGPPAREGATFIGWATNGGNLAADEVSFPYTVAAAGLTFYAIWEVDYTVQHIDKDTGQVLSQTSGHEPEGTTIAPGYLDVSTLLPALYRTESQAGHGTVLAFTGAPHTITYSYVRQFTVTLSANGGSFPAGATTSFLVDRNGSVQSSQMPGATHANKDFDYWFVQTGPGTGSRAFNSSGRYTVTGNAVLAVSWAQRPVTPPEESSSSETPPPASSSSSAPASSSSRVSSSSSVVGSSSSAPTSSGASSTSVPISGSTTPTIIESEPPQPAEQNIGNGGIPLGGLSFTDGWSLISLLLALAAAVCGVFNLIRWVVKKEDACYDGNGEPIVSKRHRNMLIAMRSLSVALALLVGIAFLLVDDMSLPVVLLNKHTLFILVLALLQPLVLVLSLPVKRGKRQAEKELQAEGDSELNQWLDGSTNA